MYWILLSFGLLLFAYFVLAKTFNYWSERGVPQYHFLVTWREILLDFIPYRTLSEGVQRMYMDYPDKRYNGMYQFTRPALSLRDPELIKQIIVRHFDHFTDHFQFFPEGSEPLQEKNLAFLNGAKWRHMRGTVTPTFTSSKMKTIFGLTSNCAKQLVNYFQEHRSPVITVEMKDAVVRFATDVIASSVFGVSCDSLRDRNNDFFLTGNQIIHFDGFLNNLKFLCILLAPKLAKAFGIRLFDDKILHFFQKLVKDNIQTRKEQNIVRRDLIHLLIEARKGATKLHKGKENEKEAKPQIEISDEDITAQALLFFFAGLDSVSTLMCFMAHELAVNPDIQKRLQNEIKEALHKCRGELTYDDLSNMKYMDMVVSESLRKWPPTIILDRVCTKPYTITPLKSNETPVNLKEGDLLWVPVFALHRDPQLFFDPDKFDPERFSDENKSSVVPYAFIPFGAGPRSCIGNKFALMETKLLFFYLLNNFDIITIDKTANPLKMAKSQFQLDAEGGFWLGLKTRKID